MNKFFVVLTFCLLTAAFHARAADGLQQLEASAEAADRAAATVERQQRSLQVLGDALYAAALQAREIKLTGDAVKDAADLLPDADAIGREIGNHLRASTKTLRELRQKIDKLEKDLEAQHKAVAKLKDELSALRRAAANVVTTPAASSSEQALAEAEGLLASGAIEDAMALFREAADKNPESVAAKTGLALCFFELGDLGSAEQIAGEVLASDRRNARATGLLGAILFRRGELSPARRQLQRAIKYDESIPYNHNYLGAVYYQQGQVDKARLSMERAVELDPGYVSARYNVALMLALMEEPDLNAARQHYEAYLELGGEPRAELVRLLGNE